MSPATGSDDLAARPTLPSMWLPNSTRWRDGMSVGERAPASINARTVTAGSSSRRRRGRRCMRRSCHAGLVDRPVAHPAVRQGHIFVRLAEAVGVSQPTAWRMGHALRLLMTREHSSAARSRSMSSTSAGAPVETPTDPAWVVAARGSRGPRKRRCSPLFSGQRIQDGAPAGSQGSGG